MTKGELKDIIRECLDEINNESTEELSLEEVALIEEASMEYDYYEAMCESAIKTLGADLANSVKNFTSNTAKEKTAKETKKKYDEFRKAHPECPASAALKQVREEMAEKKANSISAKLGTGFKSVGGKIVAVDKKKAAIAVAVTAAISAGIALGVKFIKDKKKSEEESGDEE